MAPTVPDGMPGRAFGEQRQLFQFGPVVHFDWAFIGFSHGDNVPICDQRASPEFGREEAGVQEFRSTGVQEFRSTGVQEFILRDIPLL